MGRNWAAQQEKKNQEEGALRAAHPGPGPVGGRREAWRWLDRIEEGRRGPASSVRVNAGTRRGALLVTEERATETTIGSRRCRRRCRGGSGDGVGGNQRVGAGDGRIWVVEVVGVPFSAESKRRRLQRREDVLRLGGAGLAEETRRRMVLVAEEGDCSEAEERTKLLQGGRPWHP